MFAGLACSVRFCTSVVSENDPCRFAQLSAAICRAYNNWLAEYCSADPARLKGVALLPLQDTQLAVAELRRAKQELGLVGIFWRPNPVQGRKLDHPDYLPIYETAAELGVALCVHEGARTILPQAGNDRYSEFGRHVACHPLEQMLASLTFCADGLLERALAAGSHAVRLLGIGLSGFERSADVQLSLFSGEDLQKSNRLDALADEIQARFGAGALSRGSGLLHEARHRPAPRPE